MLKLHKLKPLVKVNRVRICIENLYIFVAENLVEWLIFLLQLKISEVSFKLNVCFAKAGWMGENPLAHNFFSSFLVYVVFSDWRSFCKIVTRTTNTVCSIFWLMLKVHELRPLVKVNRVRIWIANSNICVSKKPGWMVDIPVAIKSFRRKL